MAEILFISQEYLRANSPINDNADWELVRPAIVMVQDIYLDKVLGTVLYNDLRAKISAGTLNNDEKVLINDYIQKMILWWVLMEAAPLFKFRYNNKGIMVKASDNSQAIDTQDMRYMMDKWRINAEAYAQKTTRYLFYNAALFPAYNQYRIDGTTHSIDNYSTGIDLDEGIVWKDPRQSNRTNYPTGQW